MKIKKESLSFAVLSLLALLLIAFSVQAKDGAKHGLEMAAQAVAPALLPLLMIFNLIMKSNASLSVQNMLAPFTEKVLRLPRTAGPAILFGLVGGYPTGALLTEGLYQSEDIDDKTARRLLRFNVNGGAAFIITTVGAVVLKSERAGLILFASDTLAALAAAVISAFGTEKVKNSHNGYSSLPFYSALSEAVSSSVKSVFNISAYIILFSALCAVLQIPEAAKPLLEITGGVVEDGALFSLPELAALLAFAGFCIHFQLFAIIKSVHMSYGDFFIWRVVHALLSYGICHLLLIIFPTEISVFSNSAQGLPAAFSLNLTLAVLMALGCAVIVLDLEGKKRKI